MPRPPSPLPAGLGAAFSVRDALAAGVSARRLRHDGLARPFRGVRAVPAAVEASERLDESPLAAEARARRADILRRARAYATIWRDDAFFIGVTSAVVWELPLPIRALRSGSGPESSTRELDAAVFAPHRATRATGVHGRQLSPASTAVRVRRGLRVTSPATTWALLGAELTVDELVAVGDAIVRIPRRRGMARGRPDDALGTLDQLAAALSAGRRRGAEKLREALTLIRVGSASTGETDLRLSLSRARLPQPELDFDVFDATGRPIGYTEIAYPRYRVLIEFEGDHHRTDRAQWQRDIEKHAACVAAGWEVIRLTAAHLYPSRQPAVERVRDALWRAGWRPDPER